MSDFLNINNKRLPVSVPNEVVEPPRYFHKCLLVCPLYPVCSCFFDNSDGNGKVEERIQQKSSLVYNSLHFHLNDIKVVKRNDVQNVFESGDLCMVFFTKQTNYGL